MFTYVAWRRIYFVSADKLWLVKSIFEPLATDMGVHNDAGYGVPSRRVPKANPTFQKRTRVCIS
jgi:hypothetical protein